MAVTLTPCQSAALLDILTHYDTYAEIRDFRLLGSLKHYGPPFTAEDKKPSTSPALQSLVSKFLLTLPGLRDLSDDFWKVHCHDIIENFEKSNLSESYDKGFIGIRKTLATAISALVEYPVRGAFGGFTKVDDENHVYDVTKAEDLARSFRDFVNGCVYGTILEETVIKASETDKLADHTPLIRAVHEFVLVNLASFMHYTLILSPKGQYLLKLIENANKLVPYMVIKQTLKIGNVASMINAMMKVALAKMSVSSLTNWIGLTQTQDEGMNLMQYIVSTVLSWDIKDLETRASKIERQREKSGKDQLHALKEYSSSPLEEQERIRKDSQRNSISIVTAILQFKSLESQLTETHHKECLDYLGIHLSIRDRKEIINTLCHSSPDHLTESVRELVSAYEPVIRQAHNAIDLSGTIGDLECFVKDMIKLAKIQIGKDGKAVVPTVGDFIQLLRKHQYASHTFIHQCCKNGPELTGWYMDWAKMAASEFQQKDEQPLSKQETAADSSLEKNSNNGGATAGAAGSLTTPLQTLFHTLPHELQRQILPELDSQFHLLTQMHADSLSRLQSVLHSQPSITPHIAKIFSQSSSSSSRPNSRSSSPLPHIRHPHVPHHHHKHKSSSTAPAADPASDVENNNTETEDEPAKIVTSSSTPPGPGAYLTRWQDLLDNTSITPLTQRGKPISANDLAVVNKSAVDVDGQQTIEFPDTDGPRVDVAERKPNTRLVIDALGKKFRELLASRSCYW